MKNFYFSLSVLAFSIGIYGCSSEPQERSRFKASDVPVVVSGCEELKERMEELGKEADC